MSKEEFQKTLHKLPNTMRAWLEEIGPLEEVKSLLWETEILPMSLGDGWGSTKVGKHRRLTVQFADRQHVQVFVKTDEGYEKAAPDAVYSFGPSL